MTYHNAMHQLTSPADLLTSLYNMQTGWERPEFLDVDVLVNKTSIQFLAPASYRNSQLEVELREEHLVHQLTPPLNAALLIHRDGLYVQELLDLIREAFSSAEAVEAECGALERFIDAWVERAQQEEAGTVSLHVPGDSVFWENELDSDSFPVSPVTAAYLRAGLGEQVDYKAGLISNLVRRRKLKALLPTSCD